MFLIAWLNLESLNNVLFANKPNNFQLKFLAQYDTSIFGSNNVIKAKRIFKNTTIIRQVLEKFLILFVSLFVYSALL